MHLISARIYLYRDMDRVMPLSVCWIVLRTDSEHLEEFILCHSIPRKNYEQMNNEINLLTVLK